MGAVSMSDDDFARSIGRIEGNLERLIIDVSELRKDVKSHTPPCRFSQEQDKRIQALEEAKALNKGWIAGALFVGSIVGSIVAKAFTLKGY
jgi:hypothetical protein